MPASRTERPGTRPASAPAAPTAPVLALSVQLGDGVAELPVARARLRRWILAALQCDASITLRFVGTREGRSLNAAFRGKDYATNVLTFEYPSDPDAPPACIADIVICLPVVKREAREQRKPPEHHLAHLVIHGALHAQGFEHEDDIEAEAMESLETALLKRFRIPDPYATRSAG